MDLDGTVVFLHTKKEELQQEMNELKKIVSLMTSLMNENRELRAMNQSSGSCVAEECTVCSTLAARKVASQFENTCDEGVFRKDLQQAKVKHELRTSSPVDFKSFSQSSVYQDKIQSFQPETSAKVKCPERILGEVAYQLDKRILSLIFQGRKRFYGFTVLNIPDKIIEVSIHPLTGEVDEGYRRYLTQRNNELMESLTQLGYKTTCHPAFAELIVNMYGIWKKSDLSSLEMNYGRSDFLRTLIITTAPQQLQNDLLVLVTCLCNMAETDKKPIFLW